MKEFAVPNGLKFESRFIDELPADPIQENTLRQVYEACYSRVNPKPASAPQVLHVNAPLASELGIHEELRGTTQFAQVFSGSALYQGMQPYAMCYGGHQFGHWAGQLGDGRAINLGELMASDGVAQTLQLKGAGPTPYSRSADGLAVLRSSLREYICSEAMHALGIPGTRALSLVLTGDRVERDMFYDGRPQMEAGAVVCRVAQSFIRFGNFEIFSSRQDKANLERLVEFTIRHHFPALLSQWKADKAEACLSLLAEVTQRTATMITGWMRVGFVHGVMNTDNMSIIGDTIDYGPYGWLDAYDRNWTPNTTDAQMRRYAFGNQPGIGQWNLLQLANALYPLVGEASPLESILTSYGPMYREAYLNMMRAKLGLSQERAEDAELVQGLETVLEKAELDYTLFFTAIAEQDFSGPVASESIRALLALSSYSEEKESHISVLESWLNQYQRRLEGEEREAQALLMKQSNPVFIPRNYIVQETIEAVEAGDLAALDSLFSMVKAPYRKTKDNEKYACRRPDWARHKAGCSMLSCSS